jgi:hypothetical protein
MRKFILAALLCAAGSSFAQVLVARQGDDSVRLTGAECKSQLVLDRLDPSVVSHYRAASAVFQGQSFVACWRLVGNAAHLVYEDGDQGIIPATELKPDPTI